MTRFRSVDDFSSPRNIHLLVELGGLDRLKNCRHGAFEDLVMIDHLGLAILSILYDGVKTVHLAAARARDRTGSWVNG